jgi:capsular exopolysaccharide synthesis family protein
VSTATLPPPPAAAPTPAEIPAPAPPRNRLAGFLRRWPWLAVGLAVGTALGAAYYFLRPAVYESTAQLLVVKNRADAAPADDEVGPQVVLLGSETVLRAAVERHLPGADARVAFLKDRLSAAREAEPGSGHPSTVIRLTFRADNPDDGPKYLRAVIDGYRDVVKELYGEPPAPQAPPTGEKADPLRAAEDAARAELREAERKLREAGPEDLAAVRQRVSAGRDARAKLQGRREVIEGELKQIRAAGADPAARAAVLQRLQPADRPTTPGGRDPDAELAQLQAERARLVERRNLGPGHPEIVALDARIKELQAELGRGGPAEDRLEAYRQKLEAELARVTAELGPLAARVEADETLAERIAVLLGEVRAAEGKLKGLEADREAARARARTDAPRPAGGFEVREVSRPGPGVKVAPSLLWSLLPGAAAGLLLGAALALVAGLTAAPPPPAGVARPPFDARKLGLPVLGHVPVMRTTDPPEVKPAAALDPALAVVLRPRSADADAVRGVRTQLLLGIRDKGSQVVLVTGPAPGDGGTTVAANLAAALARADKRVILVDADFRRPRVHKAFGLSAPAVGLAAVLADKADLADAVYPCEVGNLSLLPAGPRPADPAELLTAPRFPEVLAELRANYDVVVLDAPPVLSASDAAAVAPQADGVVLVVRADPDAGAAAGQAKEALAAAGKLLGVVVNLSAERGAGRGSRYDYPSADAD